MVRCSMETCAYWPTPRVSRYSCDSPPVSSRSIGLPSSSGNPAPFLGTVSAATCAAQATCGPIAATVATHSQNKCQGRQAGTLRFRFSDKGRDNHMLGAPPAPRNDAGGTIAFFPASKPRSFDKCRTRGKVPPWAGRLSDEPQTAVFHPLPNTPSGITSSQKREKV